MATFSALRQKICSAHQHWLLYSLPSGFWVTVQTTYLWSWQWFFLSPWKTSMVSAFTLPLCIKKENYVSTWQRDLPITATVATAQLKQPGLRAQDKGTGRSKLPSHGQARGQSREPTVISRGSRQNSWRKGAMFVNWKFCGCKHLSINKLYPPPTRDSCTEHKRHFLDRLSKIMDIPQTLEFSWTHYAISFWQRIHFPTLQWKAIF